MAAGPFFENLLSEWSMHGMENVHHQKVQVGSVYSKIPVLRTQCVHMCLYIHIHKQLYDKYLLGSSLNDENKHVQQRPKAKYIYPSVQFKSQPLI